MSDAVIKGLGASGLPLHLDAESETVTPGGDLVVGGRGCKTVSDMRGLLADETDLDPSERCYETYRAICHPKDREIFERYDMSYDITVVHSGTVNGECKKTSGHYHGWNPSHTNTYGEVYEVIAGSALFVLQRSPDFEEDPAGAHVDDVILASVPAGETLLVPPNYGHCSVNVGVGPLIFSNVAYRPCPVLYESVRARHGMACYIARDASGGLMVRANPHYAGIDAPAPRYASVREDRALGIDFSQGAYQNFIERPDAFDHLSNPDDHLEDIMSLLAVHERPHGIGA